VIVKSSIIWDKTPCSQVKGNQLSEEYITSILLLSLLSVSQENLTELFRYPAVLSCFSGIPGCFINKLHYVLLLHQGFFLGLELFNLE
jgi:hypothetical protein